MVVAVHATSHFGGGSGPLYVSKWAEQPWGCSQLGSGA